MMPEAVVLDLVQPLAADGSCAVLMLEGTVRLNPAGGHAK